MEEEALSRRSVAELAGRFKGSAPSQDAAGQEKEKPVRRRPPRSLQLPKSHAEDVEQPEVVTSPLTTKAKRNSALIEKLQATLVLSPTALMPSPKSPGFRLLSPTFPPTSSSSAPASMVTTPSTPSQINSAAASPLTEEGSTSFEAPPTAAEGAVLPSINKSRARHSIKRRPPSRRHRTASIGDKIDNAKEPGDEDQSSPCKQKDKTGAGEREEDGTDKVKEEKTDVLLENKSSEEENKGFDAKPEEEKEERGETGLTEGGEYSTERKEEEEDLGKSSADKEKEGSAEEATQTREEENNREEEKSLETTCQSSS